MTEKRKRTAPLVAVRRVSVPIGEAMQELGPKRWRGRTEADLLLGYLESLEGKLAHVIGSPDALPESQAVADDALADLEQAERFIATLGPSLAGEVWNCMRLVLLAESVATNELHARAAQAGGGSIRGGKKGAALSRPDRDGDILRARELYQFHAAGTPEASRKSLCAAVAGELGVKPKTIAAWVPNPRAERRGRPRKK